MKDYVRDLYKRLSENIDETPELFHCDYFKLEGGELYYIGSRKPLTTEGKLKSVGMLADILGKNRLRRLGFNMPVGKLTARQAVMLNKAAEELPSESDITKADDIELQEIAEKASGIISQIKDAQTDTEDLFKHPLRELLGLDKQLRSIRGSLKVEVTKKVQLEEHITKEHRKLEEFREYPGVYDDEMKEDITKQIDALNDELATRQESIDLLKGRLKNQITSFKEMIAKVLDKDTSLGEKIRTPFREQGITIASILTAIRMAIGVLVEALLPGGAATASGGGGFHIVNFPFMSSNIPSAPAYGVYASQLVRYACCCSSYSDFLICHRALVKRLLSQGYKVNRLPNIFKKFYGRHTDLVGQYKKNVCQMFADSIS